MEPLISVIVPVYKVEAYLDKCIQSIVDQTYRNLEIILVDDGSPDRCPEICDEWALKDDRIWVIHQENKGLSGARNTGLDCYTGDYLMFVDSDDYIHFDAVRILYEKLAADDSDMAVGNAVCVDESGKCLRWLYTMVEDSVKNQHDIISELASKKAIPCVAWGKLYCRKVFEELRFAVAKYAEDVWIQIDVIKKCTRISSVSKILYYYVQRPTSLVHTLTDDKILDSVGAEIHMANELINMGFHVIARAYYTTAISRAAEMSDPTPARNVLKEHFSWYQRVWLLRYNVHSMIRILALHLPSVRWVLRQRKMRREQNT